MVAAQPRSEEGTAMHLGCIWIPHSMLRRVIICLSAVLTGGPAVAQAPELTRLHALLVVDTRSGLGESVVLDGRRVKSLLQTGIPPNRLDVTVYDKPSQLTRESILRYYRNLKTGPSEAVVFYYAGHGATDPSKGHFLALQELHTEPLTRDELRQAMLQKNPGLAVLLTDCCSNRYELKKKNRDVWDSEHREFNPVVRNLFFQQRGVVDLTASTGAEAFGDEHQGGIFTRTLGKLLLSKSETLDTNRDGFVDWKEFFPRLQNETEKVFVSWAQQHRGQGEEVSQKSQRPRALYLPGDQVPGTSAAVTLRNETDRTIQYEYRWGSSDSWKNGSIGPKKSVTHPVPSGQDAAVSRLEIRSIEGKGTAKAGSTLRFHD